MEHMPAGMDEEISTGVRGVGVDPVGGADAWKDFNCQVSRVIDFKHHLCVAAGAAQAKYEISSLHKIFIRARITCLS